MVIFCPQAMTASPRIVEQIRTVRCADLPMTEFFRQFACDACAVADWRGGVSSTWAIGDGLDRAPGCEGLQPYECGWAI